MDLKTLAAAIVASAATSLVILAATGALAPKPKPAVTRLASKGTFPIASGVVVPAGAETVYLSGQLADPAKPDAPKDSPDYYGDTETQTISVLNKIKALLAEKNMGMGDVVMMHVYLAGDPAKGGAMDFKGLMAAYTKYFATEEQPNKPARSTFQVANLVSPGFLVEIEVIAAK